MGKIYYKGHAYRQMYSHENGTYFVSETASPVISILDVHRDGTVHFLFNGNCEKLGTLKGNEVIKGEWK